MSASTATAVWFPQARMVELQQEPVPELGPGDIRVRALCSAISQGTEMLVYRGQVDPGLPLDLPTLRGGFGFPIKYGYASVGRVKEVGKEVRIPSAGDLVFVHHPHQSEYVVPATAAIVLPPQLQPEAGVFLANVETAVNVMLDAHPRLADRVVVFGAGVVGLLLLQLLRRAGVGTLIAVEPNPRRRALAGTVGAEVATMPGEHLLEEILALTEGVGADLAIEATGNPAALTQALESVGFQGTVVACSWYGRKPVTVDLGGRFHRQRVRVISSQVSNLDPALGPRWTMRRRMQVARDLLSTLQTAPLISHRFALDQAVQAYRLLDQGADDAVQVVFTYV